MKRLTNNIPCYECEKYECEKYERIYTSHCRVQCKKMMLWKKQIYLRLQIIEDILGDEYELENLKTNNS